MIRWQVPLLGFCAWSGTGKTTLLRKLLPLLRSEGLRLAVVKHAHEDFEIDRPGKDSYELRNAGAEQVLVASRRRMALIRELNGEQGEPPLEEALHCLDPAGLDLVLVEGYKAAAIPKIELHRQTLGRPLFHPSDPHVIAVATDAPLETRLPRFDLDQPRQIADFILWHTAQQRKPAHGDTPHSHRSRLRR